MARKFYTLDVFTETKLTGNPLGIISDAGGMTGEQMKAVAAELNLSETVFILPPEKPGHSAKIRIFTPVTEIAFAGHPTVGAAIHIAMKQVGEITQEQDCIVVLEEKIGSVRVGVKLFPNKAPFAEFDIPVKPEETIEDIDKDQLSLALGLTKSEIGFENHVPSAFYAGMDILFVPVADLGVMKQVKVNEQALALALGEDHKGVYLYCRETVKKRSSFHARMFAPALGISEDSATGGAAAAFAGVIKRFDQPVAGEHQYLIEQGFEMGRPSEIKLELVIDQGLHAVRIGGAAVPILEGTIDI